MRRKICSFLLSFLFVCAIQCSSLAQESKTFIVGVEDLSYFPQYSASDKGEFMGFARSVLDAFAASKGYKFEYRPLPINRLYSNLIKGELDFKYPDSPEWGNSVKKDVQVYYSDAISSYTDGTIVLEENLNNGLDSIKTLGTVTGFTLVGYHDKIKPGQVTISENSSLINLLRQVVSGRIDGAYVNIDVALYTQARFMAKDKKLIFNKNLPYVSSSYMISTTRNPEIILEINEFLKNNKDYISSLENIYFANSR